MTRTISAMELRTKLGEIMNLAYYGGDEIIVERNGEPFIKIIKADNYSSMEKEIYIKKIAKYRGIFKNMDMKEFKKRTKEFRESFKLRDRMLKQIHDISS